MNLPGGPISIRATESYRLAITPASNGAPLRFRDLMSAVVLGNLKEGVRFQIERDGVADPFWVVVHPAERTAERLSPTVGVESPRSTQLLAKHPVRKGSPTADLEKFKGGDKILAVAGQNVHDYATLVRQLAHHPADTLRLSIERARRPPTTAEPKMRPSRLKPSTSTCRPIRSGPLGCR